MILIFTLLLLCTVKSQITLCGQQLFNYYASLGMQYGGPPLNPVNVTFVGSQVEIDFDFESIARFYQSQTPSLANSSPPIINYVSFDFPWCTTQVEVLCGGQLIRALPKTALCDIIDYDVFNPTFAGRAFIYNNEATNGTTLMTGCIGNIVIRLSGNFGILVNATQFFSFVTYSKTGLPLNSTNLTLQQAITEYENTLCLFTNGATPLVAGQEEFVCRDNPIAQVNCIGERPDVLIHPLLPVPSYACVGPSGEANDTRILWFINVFSETNSSITGVRYALQFCESFDAACIASALALPQDDVTFAGTRTQYISPFSDFTSLLVLVFGANESTTRPIYPFAVTDPFIRAVPCICGLSMDCLANGKVNLGAISKVLKPNNSPPVANASSVSILPGVKTVTLDGNSSFDPDNGPNLLTYFWEIYNATPTPVTIDNPHAPIINVTGDFVIGVYRFILYVGDGQEKTFHLVNITVQANIIHIILPFFITVQWHPVDVCPPPGQLPPTSEAIALNASATFGENPNITLFYNWTQIAGPRLPVPFQCDPATVSYFHVAAFFNQNQSIAYFIPPALGIYTFRLTVSDHGFSPNRTQDIHVSVESKFIRPNATDQNFTGFPDSPIYRLPNRTTVPTVSFSPTTEPPLNDLTRSPNFNNPVPTPVPIPFSNAPTINITPPPTPLLNTGLLQSVIFPRLPEPTLVEWALLLLALVAMVLGWIAIFGTCLAFLKKDYEVSKLDRVATDS